MLPTDWARPSGLVQRRISDLRVAQFWDKEHLVAGELKRQFPSSDKLCCQRNGILWDVAALYPSSVQWGSSTPIYFGGAVVDVASEVRQNLLALRLETWVGIGAAKDDVSAGFRDCNSFRLRNPLIYLCPFEILAGRQF
jgi:hypothetical protein